MKRGLQHDGPQRIDDQRRIVEIHVPMNRGLLLGRLFDWLIDDR